RHAKHVRTCLARGTLVPEGQRIIAGGKRVYECSPRTAGRWILRPGRAREERGQTRARPNLAIACFSAPPDLRGAMEFGSRPGGCARRLACPRLIAPAAAATDAASAVRGLAGKPQVVAEGQGNWIAVGAHGVVRQGVALPRLDVGATR